RMAAIDASDLPSAWETQTGVVVGTPRYMAPEQQQGDPATPLADQYAWCVALWTALVGQAPYDGSFVELAIEKRLGVPRRPKKLPRRLYKVLARGLAPDPHRRFAGLQEVLEAVEASSRAGWAIAAVAVAGFGVATAVSGPTLGHIGQQWTSTTACASEASQTPTLPEPTGRSTPVARPAHVPDSELSSSAPGGD
ncbi:MAG: hypothetical protein AAF721_07775, partial [Myxococcota bacterium]